MQDRRDKNRDRSKSYRYTKALLTATAADDDDSSLIRPNNRPKPKTMISLPRKNILDYLSVSQARVLRVHEAAR